MSRAKVLCVLVSLAAAHATIAGLPPKAAGRWPPNPLRLPTGGLLAERAPGVATAGTLPLASSLIAPRVTASVRVNSVVDGGQHLPTITLGPAGQVYVAWVDCLADQDCTTNNPDVYFAKSIDGGRTFSPRVLVSDDGSGAFANAPKVATDADGNIYVVWQDNRAATATDDSWDVYLAKSDDGGDTFGASVMVDEHVVNTYQYEPDLAVTPDGTVYVSWERYFYDGQAMQWDADVYVAKSTDGGVSFGTKVKASDGANYQYKSTIGVGPSGNVYVAWSDFRADGSGDIYFARSTDGGGTFSTNLQVNAYTTAAQVYPELAIDADETVYVVWLDARRFAESANDIYMARSTNLGASFGDEVRVSDADLPATSVTDYLYPVVTAAGDGDVAAAWYDMRTGDTDTYMTRSYDGGLTVAPSWRVNDLTANSQSVPDVLMAPDLHVYCVYRDYSTSDFDIYFVLDLTVGSRFYPLTPCRVVDTRVSTDPAEVKRGNFADDEVRAYTLSDSTDCPGLPTDATAWSLNVQLRPISVAAYLLAFPDGVAQPAVSTLVASPDRWRVNNAIVPAGSGATFDVYCQYASRVVVDVNGYFK